MEFKCQLNFPGSKANGLHWITRVGFLEWTPLLTTKWNLPRLQIRCVYCRYEIYLDSREISAGNWFVFLSTSISSFTFDILLNSLTFETIKIGPVPNYLCISSSCRKHATICVGTAQRRHSNMVHYRKTPEKPLNSIIKFYANVQKYFLRYLSNAQNPTVFSNYYICADLFLIKSFRGSDLLDAYDVELLLDLTISTLPRGRLGINFRERFPDPWRLSLTSWAV